ncbi:glycosyltransferase [Aliarcobacter skirrowii]|uniref:glycosyltransferase n=1 Tax=Aliarcobacter skirrowii TaxID=28200 RepID=UPI0029A9629B|nr:glycosyltransferase [Aliarcobacter skirrowii]MDX4012944.1 glycosyltransferase [Aliarcobacter skirrowii]
MKVSVIIAVYKDVEALELIIESLKNQTYKNFEVIIAEDANNNEMKEFISQIKDLDVIHTFQEDIGLRKTRSQNNAIIQSSGEYLIFIDGDCVPYSTFIESHVKLAETGYILSGRRVNLGPIYSKKLRQNIISPIMLERFFILRYPLIAKDCIEGHSEEGFYFSPNGWMYKLFLKNRNFSKSLLGCNYSCFKKDMIEINGYDEGYGESAVGTDTDLEWRFKALGLKIKSVRFVANVFHLHHKTNPNFYIKEKESLNLMKDNQKQNKYICDFGLNTH